MTSYIKFTPISGARNEDPLCYLLELDDAKILLDCGWNDATLTESLAHVKRYVVCHLLMQHI
jgi:cleavage and polyadenylation specificity factor subunit 2